jgi:hypothetical protein
MASQELVDHGVGPDQRRRLLEQPDERRNVVQGTFRALAPGLGNDLVAGLR